MTSGWLPWWGWLLIGACIFSWVIFEHAYRVINRLSSELQKERAAAGNTQREHTAAIREQTEELRRQREVTEREADPLIRLLRARQEETLKTGAAKEEVELNTAIWIVGVKSAWGRWQDATRGGKWDEQARMHLAVSVIQHKAETGELLIRASRSGSTTYEFIPPDLMLKTACLRIERHPSTLWRVYVGPRGTGDGPWPPEIPKYDSLRVETRRLRELWPENDPLIDDRTAKLLAQKVVSDVTSKEPQS